ncbi:hypothetical protein GCWU000341_00726 [Oribacterium sp. oral taxon 078 str. F0262]|nr:hypothetical protein GCWU000341_00726 [Oribacterium sp. oral taxon 078 str. F0262]
MRASAFDNAFSQPRIDHYHPKEGPDPAYALDSAHSQPRIDH